MINDSLEINKTGGDGFKFLLKGDWPHYEGLKYVIGIIIKPTVK